MTVFSNAQCNPAHAIRVQPEAAIGDGTIAFDGRAVDAAAEVRQGVVDALDRDAVSHC